MNDNKEKSINQRKKKLIKFLVISCIVLGLTKFVLDTTVFSDINIEKRVNSNLPISVTMQDAIYVKNYGIDRYINYLKIGESKNAYAMLTDEYKDYKTYKEYLNELEGIDFSTFKLQEVKQLSEKTYVTPVEYMRNGILEEETYLLLVNKVNEKDIRISPDRFLYALEKNKSFSKDGIKFVIEEGIINSDIIKLKIKIKNNNFFDEVKINSLGVAYNENESKTKIINDDLIKPRSSKTYEIEIESIYDIPKYLKVERVIDDKVLRTYLFEL